MPSIDHQEATTGHPRTLWCAYGESRDTTHRPLANQICEMQFSARRISVHFTVHLESTRKFLLRLHHSRRARGKPSNHSAVHGGCAERLPSSA